MKSFKIDPAHPTDQHHNVTDGNFVIHCHYKDEAQSVLRAVNNHAKLLEALEGTLPALDSAWERAIMATDAPISAQLAKIEEGMPEANSARAAIEEARK